MDRPRTATEAAAVLAELTDANVGRRLVRRSPSAPPFEPVRPFDPETGHNRPLDLSDMPGHRMRRPDPGPPWLVESLPAVLVAVPDQPENLGGSLVGARMDRDFGADLIAEEWSGFPYPVGVPLDPGVRHRDGERVRRLVLAGPEVASPSPAGSRALAVSVLTARHTASQLDKWATVLPVGAARRADREAGVYRGYAEAAEALIPASWEWADDLEIPAGTPALSYVPAQLRGVAVRGDSNP